MRNPLKKKKKKNVEEEAIPEFLQAEMQHARIGVLYVFSKTDVDGKFGSLFLSSILDTAGSYMGGVGKMEDIKGLSIASKVTSAVKVPANEAVKYFEGQANKGAKSNIPKLEEQTDSKFWAFCKMLWAKLTRDVPASMSNWGALLKTIIKGVVGMVVAAAVPLSGIFDVVSGTAKACQAGFQRVMAWAESRSTSLVDGYPTVIVKAIQKAMNRSIGEGLYTAMKGGVQIGVDVAAAGAGSLVKAIATAIELLAQVIQRIVEIEIFNAFSREAKVHYEARTTSGFTKEPKTFATWLERHAFKVPAIGAIAMNCGYCGSPMQYLAMFNGDNQTISSKDYLSGVSMLARHKQFAADYLNDIGLAFKSADPVVNGALKAAKNYGQINHIKQNKAKDVVMGILTG